MWAAVRPDGAIVVEDGDFDAAIAYPPNEGHAFWADTYRRVLERHGGDPTAGRKLYSHFLEAGIPAPTVRLRQLVHVAGEEKTLPLLTLDATADAVVAEGIATEDEVRRARASLAEISVDTTTIILAPAGIPAVVPPRVISRDVPSGDRVIVPRGNEDHPRTTSAISADALRLDRRHRHACRPGPRSSDSRTGSTVGRRSGTQGSQA